MAGPGIAYNRNCALYKQHSAASTVTVKGSPGTVHKLIVGGGSSGVGIWFGTSIKLTLAHADDEVTVAYT